MGFVTCVARVAQLAWRIHQTAVAPLPSRLRRLPFAPRTSMARGGLRRLPGGKARAAPKRSAPAKTPAKSKAAVQNSALDLFNDVEKSGLQYLMRGFEANSGLAPWLASLMRDGILEKTMRLKQVGTQHLELGKKLPEKCRRARNLPPRLWDLLWLNLWQEPPARSAERNSAQTTTWVWHSGRCGSPPTQTCQLVTSRRPMKAPFSRS